MVSELRCSGGGVGWRSASRHHSASRHLSAPQLGWPWRTPFLSYRTMFRSYVLHAIPQLLLSLYGITVESHVLLLLLLAQVPSRRGVPAAAAAASFARPPAQQTAQPLTQRLQGCGVGAGARQKAAAGRSFPAWSGVMAEPRVSMQVGFLPTLGLHHLSLSPTHRNIPPPL